MPHDTRRSRFSTLIALIGIVAAIGSAGCLQIGADEVAPSIDSEAVQEAKQGDIQAAPAWSELEPIRGYRSNLTATTLQDGRMLLVGGLVWGGGPHYTNWSDILDPGTGSWSPVASTTYLYAHHTANLLKDGRVLVAGGSGEPSGHMGAEIYDPVADAWTQVPAMVANRHSHAAALLRDGRVLVAGGDIEGGGIDGITSALLFNPSSHTWSPTRSMRHERRDFTLIQLRDNRVLAAGGYHHGATATAELFDPDLGTWTPTSSMHYPRYDHAAVLLSDGKVLVVGGLEPLPSAEIFDPATDTWSLVASLSGSGGFASGARLPNGCVFVTVERSVRLYDPHADTWTPLDPIQGGLSSYGMALLPGGTAVVAGGVAGKFANTNRAHAMSSLLELPCEVDD